MTIELPGFDPQHYQECWAILGAEERQRGNSVRHVMNNNTLNTLLGDDSWWWRICNAQGDFTYVVQGSFRYWLKMPSPVKDYRDTNDGSLTEVLIYRPESFMCTFTRGEGSWVQYKEGNWKAATAPTE